MPSRGSYEMQTQKERDQSTGEQWKCNLCHLKIQTECTISNMPEHSDILVSSGKKNKQRSPQTRKCNISQRSKKRELAISPPTKALKKI